MMQLETQIEFLNIMIMILNIMIEFSKIGGYKIIIEKSVYPIDNQMEVTNKN